MPYYPLSQIKTNLQTDGSTYQTPDGNPYSGFYYEVANGKLFTGKSPQSGANLELTLLREQQSTAQDESQTQSQIVPAFNPGDPDPKIAEQYQKTFNVYREYTNLSTIQPTILSPYYNPNFPTDEDYTIGEFRRYFTKRANSIMYLEIDKIQYDLIVNEDSSIMWSLYIPFEMPWSISGDKNQVATTNENIVKLTSFRNKLPKLGDYLKNNYIKYYK